MSEKCPACSGAAQELADALHRLNRVRELLEEFMDWHEYKYDMATWAKGTIQIAHRVASGGVGHRRDAPKPTKGGNDE